MNDSIRVHDARAEEEAWFRIVREYPHIELRAYGRLDATNIRMDRDAARRLADWLNEWLADE